MKIALIGYGKMGKAIEEIAIERGHSIVAKINQSTPIESLKSLEADVAIEFTRPDAAVANIQFCLNHSLPVVVGTTAWYDAFEHVKNEVAQHNGALLHASNFSVGVNIFFEINRMLAQLMQPYAEYTASVEEIHHLQKLDAPSGTAVTIANAILENNPALNTWKLGEENHPTTQKNELAITSYRKPDVPGTHIVKYQSSIDTIEIMHEAHNRKGFALGAVLAAEFLKDKKGIFTMSDVLNIGK
ncbi:MAG TPA: 4-hydroxy-tetrahydrodipicolinate reductase [Taishania sp.]|nr:4-hydroxy-tetrahydrodipicolinate reductase [Taishania sp.]